MTHFRERSTWCDREGDALRAQSVHEDRPPGLSPPRERAVVKRDEDGVHEVAGMTRVLHPCRETEVVQRLAGPDLIVRESDDDRCATESQTLPSAGPSGSYNKVSAFGERPERGKRTEDCHGSVITDGPAHGLSNASIGHNENDVRVASARIINERDCEVLDEFVASTPERDKDVRAARTPRVRVGGVQIVVIERDVRQATQESPVDVGGKAWPITAKIRIDKDVSCVSPPRKIIECNDRGPRKAILDAPFPVLSQPVMIDHDDVRCIRTSHVQYPASVVSLGTDRARSISHALP
ncbi:MAG: hypothetical protein O3C70_00900 [Actinomycetota bacterium]|nr:hypothetical protein [Actinomycetota bacterium]